MSFFSEGVPTRKAFVWMTHNQQTNLNGFPPGACRNDRLKELASEVG